MKNILSILFVAVVLFSCSENKSVKKQTTFCNPMNLDYGWGNFQTREKKARSAADPIIVLFKNKYYLFTTMDIGGYRVSDDLITWKNIYFNPEVKTSALDVDHYVAPAVAADENYVYFVNFTRDRTKKTVDVIRSSDPENGKWEKCGEVRRMADPCLFIDNGRFFFYYGLGGTQSTTFFEVDPATFKSLSHRSAGAGRAADPSSAERSARDRRMRSVDVRCQRGGFLVCTRTCPHMDSDIWLWLRSHNDPRPDVYRPARKLCASGSGFVGDGADQKGAERRQGLIRHIEYDSSADIAEI